MQKLYCYVDEPGQETLGKLFVVSVVVLGDERYELLQLCEQIEKISEKRKDKWGRAKHERRMRYLRHILADDRFRGKLFYGIFRRTREYDAASVEAIAKAVLFKVPSGDYKATVYIDGLSKTKRHHYAVALRRYGVRIRKVVGVSRDESNALIRLADTLAGFVGDALLSKGVEIQDLYQRAKRDQLLVEIRK